MHILVVDDKAAVREKVGGLLAQLGYTYECANNGLDALEKAQVQTFNLYIIDHLMPVMNGIQLIKNLKSKQETANIPVIFMTTQDLNSLHNVKELKQCQEIIAKPINEETFFQLINKLLVENSLVHSL
ncbi:response regulator [Thalassotalea sp. SU-HH00458]|uniref:response regulator n=1 Tax=Thalassotalea sp. SU-HH00458 TaxID=3127657 RepID=UPI0031032F71